MQEEFISNCLIFVWQRYRAQGGYVIIMHSLYGWWPHFVWTPDLIHCEEFAPTSKYARWFPPIFFLGRIQKWVVADGPERGKHLIPYVEPLEGEYLRD